jgi:hypothetical protein
MFKEGPRDGRSRSLRGRPAKGFKGLSVEGRKELLFKKEDNSRRTPIIPALWRQKLEVGRLAAHPDYIASSRWTEMCIYMVRNDIHLYSFGGLFVYFVFEFVFCDSDGDNEACSSGLGLSHQLSPTYPGCSLRVSITVRKKPKTNVLMTE